VVLEPKQSLREPFEERGICSHQDYCGHFWYPLLNRLVKKQPKTTGQDRPRPVVFSL